MIKKYNITYSTVISHCAYVLADQCVKATQLEAATYTAHRKAYRLAQKTGSIIHAVIYTIEKDTKFILARFSTVPHEPISIEHTAETIASVVIGLMMFLGVDTLGIPK